MKRILSGLLTLVIVGYYIWVFVGNQSLNSAIDLYDERKYEQALTKVDSSFGIGRDNERSHVVRAMIFVDTKKYDEAMIEANKALEFDLDKELKYHALDVRAKAHLKLGQPDQSLRDYNAALPLAEDPTYIHGQRGICFFERGEFKEALADFEIYLAKQPDSTGHLAFQAYSYEGLGEYQESIESLTKALEVDGEAVWLLTSRSDAYEKAGETRKAIADYDRVVELEPTAEHFKARGWLNAEVDDKKAIEDFTKAIELNPKDDVAFNGRGWSYQKLGKNELALVDYEKSIELDPTWKQPRLNRRYLLWSTGEKAKALASTDKTSLDYSTIGNVRSHKGDFEGALASFNKALEITPDYPDALDGRSSAYRALDRYQEALGDSQKLVELQPENAGHLNGHAWDLAILGYYKKAEPFIQKSLKLQPDEPQSLDTLAYIRVGQGRYEEADEVYTRALKGDNSMAASYFGRGTARKSLGQKDKAAADFATAEKLGLGIKLKWLPEKGD